MSDPLQIISYNAHKTIVVIGSTKYNLLIFMIFTFDISEKNAIDHLVDYFLLNIFGKCYGRPSKKYLWIR